MPNLTNAVIVEPPRRHDATVLWLHGLGADGHDFEPIVPELRLPSDHGIKFVFPHAPQRAVTINGGYVMRAWYDVKSADLRSQEDEAGIKNSTAIVMSYFAKERELGIRPDRIILAGFSQGGAIALYCGLRYEDPLAGILALSTYLPLPETTSLDASSQSLQTPILMCHGVADPLIPLHQGKQTSDFLERLGYQVAWQEYPMQHAVCSEEIDDIGEWLCARLPSA
jgi:phospholipase/carboxylesterase